MSQWARENPELAEQGLDYLDAHSDLADMAEDFGPRKERDSEARPSASDASMRTPNGTAEGSRRGGP